MLDSNLQLRENDEEIEGLRNHTESLTSEIEDLNILQQQNDRQKELELESVQHEYLEKERRLVQLIIQKTNLDIDFDMER